MKKNQKKIGSILIGRKDMYQNKQQIRNNIIKTHNR